jgi:hypothetical protein
VRSGTTDADQGGESRFVLPLPKEPPADDAIVARLSSLNCPSWSKLQNGRSGYVSKAT